MQYILIQLFNNALFMQNNYSTITYEFSTKYPTMGTH
jgi:hypothetical protein